MRKKPNENKIVEGKNPELTKEGIENFLSTRDKLTPVTLAAYRRALLEFFDWLPSDKIITTAAVLGYRKHLIATKKASTANQRFSAVNQFIKFLSCPEGKAAGVVPEAVPTGSLGQREYRKLLRLTEEEGDDLLHLVLSILYNLDISHDTIIETITVESVRKGFVLVEEGGILVERRLIPSLAKDILGYAASLGIKSGPVFKAPRGGRMDRSVLSHRFRRVANIVGLSKSVTLGSVRRLGRAKAAEIAARAVLHEMELMYVPYYKYFEYEEENTQMSESIHSVNQVMALTNENIKKALGVSEMSGNSNEEYVMFLFHCLDNPYEAVETWRGLCNALVLGEEEWIKDYISACLQEQAPILSPKAIDMVKDGVEYACIRRYIDLPVKTPGVEVYYQDGAYHIASPVSHEWLAADEDGEEGLDLTRNACRAVEKLLEEANICFYNDAADFLGWKARAIPANIKEFDSEELLFVNAEGVVEDIYNDEEEKWDDVELEFIDAVFCCRKENAAAVETFLCQKRNHTGGEKT